MTRAPLCARLALAALIGVVAASGGGCATFWATSQIVAGRPPFDENAREQSVPLPGVTERLGVTLHLEGKPVPPANAAMTQNPTPAPAPTTSAAPPDPVVECVVVQNGREQVYRAASYYGKTWKWTAGISFLIEGAIAAVYLLAGSETGHYVIGGYLAADALVTGGLFFAPRRDIYERSERATSLRVRNDCPEGLLLEVAGRPVPIDADGRLSPLALALIERHITGTPEPIRVRLGAFGGEIQLDPAIRCSWARRRSLAAATELCKIAGAEQQTSMDRGSRVVVLDVPLGLLTSAP